MKAAARTIEATAPPIVRTTPPGDAFFHYYHKLPPSWISKAVRAALRLVRLKHYLARATKKSRIIRGMEMPDPPRYLAARTRIRKEVIQGRNVFHVSPKTKSSGHHVLYFHGGAYMINFTRRHWDLVLAVVEQTGCTVVTPDYPLSPEASYRERYEMAIPLFQQLSRQFGADRISLMGESAGANLCLSLAQQLVAAGSAPPGQLILLSPWLDVSMTNPAIAAIEKQDPFLPVSGARFAGLAHAGDLEPCHPLVSPIYGSLQGLENISIFTGTHDILYPDARRLKELAEAAGLRVRYYEYPQMIHAWMIFRLPESTAARKQILQLIQDRDQELARL